MNDPAKELNEELEKARKQIEHAHQEWMAALDVVEDPIFLHDKDFRILRCNKAYQQCAGIPFKQIIGQPYYDVFPKTHAPLRHCLRKTEEVEEGDTDEEVLVGDTTYRSRSFPIKNEQGNYLYSIHAFEDISERKQAEDALLRSTRALKTLSAGNLALVRAANEDELLRSVTRVIVETGGYLMAWVGYAEDDVAKTVRPVAQSGYEEGYLDTANITWADTERGRGPTGTAIREGVTVINQDCLTNPKIAPWREAAIKRGYQSSIAIPLIRIKRVLGALTIYSADPFAFSKDEVALLEELASDLAFGIETLRTRLAHEQHATILRLGLEQSIQTIAGTLEARDPYTAGHQRRVGELATAIAREMALPFEQVNGIRLAAIIHDLGKIRIPAEILSKPSKLTDIEYALIKTHPQAGYDILKDVKFPWPIADIILQHHERLDGSGYPQGLRDGQILLESRIMAVADVVEAMSSHRPYRPSLGIAAALGEIERGRGSVYDPVIVDACLRLFANKGFTFSGNL